MCVDCLLLCSVVKARDIYQDTKLNRGKNVMWTGQDEMKGREERAVWMCWVGGESWGGGGLGGGESWGWERVGVGESWGWGRSTGERK